MQALSKRTRDEAEAQRLGNCDACAIQAFSERNPDGVDACAMQVLCWRNRDEADAQRFGDALGMRMR